MTVTQKTLSKLVDFGKAQAGLYYQRQGAPTNMRLRFWKFGSVCDALKGQGTPNDTINFTRYDQFQISTAENFPDTPND